MRSSKVNNVNAESVYDDMVQNGNFVVVSQTNGVQELEYGQYDVSERSNSDVTYRGTI